MTSRKFIRKKTLRSKKRVKKVVNEAPSGWLTDIVAQTMETIRTLLEVPKIQTSPSFKSPRNQYKESRNLKKTNIGGNVTRNAPPTNGGRVIAMNTNQVEDEPNIGYENLDVDNHETIA